MSNHLQVELEHVRGLLAMANRELQNTRKQLEREIFHGRLLGESLTKARHLQGELKEEILESDQRIDRVVEENQTLQGENQTLRKELDQVEKNRGLLRDQVEELITEEKDQSDNLATELSEAMEEIKDRGVNHLEVCQYPRSGSCTCLPPSVAEHINR